MKFQLIWSDGFREDFFYLANHKQELYMTSMAILYRLSGFRVGDILEIDQPETRIVFVSHFLVTDQDEMSNLYRGCSRDSFYTVSVHFAKRFQRRIYLFRNRPTRNRNCLWWPCLLTDRNEKGNRNRGSFIDVFYQFSVDLDKRFQRRRFLRNWPIRNNNCLWRPCLLTDREEMSHLYRVCCRYYSYKVSVHLAKRF